MRWPNAGQLGTACSTPSITTNTKSTATWFAERESRHTEAHTNSESTIVEGWLPTRLRIPELVKFQPDLRNIDRHRSEEGITLTLSLGIMQPYFLPYIGYFQLIALVDEFVIYDNIKYTKKGWINRNRFLLNGRESTFALPLQSAPDNMNVAARKLAEEFNRDRFLNRLRGAYAGAPFFNSAFPLVERIVGHTDKNLFRFVHNSVTQTCSYLGIDTPIIVSSSLNIDHSLRAQAKVLALCKAREAGIYINPIGGAELYAREDFASECIELRFHKANTLEYAQFGKAFVPWLSIVDVLMFNPLEWVRDAVFNNYSLV